MRVRRAHGFWARAPVRRCLAQDGVGQACWEALLPGPVVRPGALFIMIARGVFAGCLLAWVAGAAAASAETSASAVRVASEDVDGDGVAEIVLENDYVRVEILTGRNPTSAVPSSWSRFWRRQSPPAPALYGTRFIGPGWIDNVVFKPTGRRWFAKTFFGGEAWRGIPEEFEQAVRLREVSPGVWRCLKLGVGLCEGRGWCFRDSLKLLDAGQWETEVEEVSGGGQRVTFTQTLNPEDGYGYRYRKSLTLMPGDSRLLVERTLANTGSRELASTWYTHAFWGQGRGGAYDEHCWGAVPLRRGPPGQPRPELDVEACAIGALPGTGYWGPLDGDLVGDAWYACGNHDGADVFLTVLPEIPAFFRVWTYAPTYSLEAFRLIDLEPGREERWLETLACGAGLDRLDTHDGVAAYSASVAPATEDSPAVVTLNVLPFRDVRNGTLQVDVRLATGAERSSVYAIPCAGPGQPVALRLDDLGGGLPARVGVRLTLDAAAGSVAAATRTGWLTLRPVSAESRGLPEHANGAGAWVLGPFERDAQGALVPSRAAGYLLEYLRTAGFTPTLRLDREGLLAAGQPLPALVVFAGMRGLSVEVLRQLEGFVQGGGGLIVCGPIEPLAFEFTDLLPLLSAGASLRLGAGPRDGTREFVGAWRRRYQLEAASDHPVLDGVSWFPESRQDVGVLQVLTPRADAEVLLRYHTPAGLLPEVSSPALLVSSYGKGRVAVLASPVDWGVPSHWLLWSRVGEEHRAFLSRLVRWTAAGALGPSASASHASDCGSRVPAE